MSPALTVYLDENVDHAVIGPLRERGYQITTAQAQGTVGIGDDEQINFAAARGWLIVSHNQRHFRRWHSFYVAHARPHAGIILLPGPSPLARLVMRCLLLLDWAERSPPAASRLFEWKTLQLALTQGERPVGFTDEAIRLALGLDAS